MAQAELTQQSVIEAGIAASLASDPELLPEPSIWFQDFSFGGTMFDAAFGNAEALGGVGEAISDVAIDNRLELERKEREENDPAKDAGMIVELAENQRRESARYMNGRFHIDGMVLTHAQFREAIDNTRARLPELARDNSWTEAETREAEGMLDELEDAVQNDPERAPQILERIGRERPELREQLTTDMQLVEQRAEASTVVEKDNIVVEEIEDTTNRRVADLEIADAAGYTQPDEAASYVERRESVREMGSVGDNPFADTRASAESFNPAARGDAPEIELAAVAPTQPTHNSNFEI